jgi:hypothetical protein
LRRLPVPHHAMTVSTSRNSRSHTRRSPSINLPPRRQPTRALVPPCKLPRDKRQSTEERPDTSTHKPTSRPSRITQSSPHKRFRCRHSVTVAAPRRRYPTSADPAERQSRRDPRRPATRRSAVLPTPSISPRPTPAPTCDLMTARPSARAYPPRAGLPTNARARHSRPSECNTSTHRPASVRAHVPRPASKGSPKARGNVRRRPKHTAARPARNDRRRTSSFRFRTAEVGPVIVPLSLLN